jgi:hypothetical protein
VQWQSGATTERQSAAHPPTTGVPALAFAWHWSGVQLLSHGGRFAVYNGAFRFLGISYGVRGNSLLSLAVPRFARIIRLICAAQEGEALPQRVARSDLHAKRSKRPPTQPSAMTRTVKDLAVTDAASDYVHRSSYRKNINAQSKTSQSRGVGTAGTSPSNLSNLQRIRQALQGISKKRDAELADWVENAKAGAAKLNPPQSAAGGLVPRYAEAACSRSIQPPRTVSPSRAPRGC